jgi:hypothetical protein
MTSHSHFHGVHINWRPQEFVHRWHAHAAWPDTVGPRRDTYNLSNNPQFALVVDVPAAVSTQTGNPRWLCSMCAACACGQVYLV